MRRRLCALLLSVLLAIVATAAAPSDTTWIFQGTILEAGRGMPNDHPLVPIGPDPRFHLKVRIDQWHGAAGPMDAGSVVDFAIHSPALLLGGATPAPAADDLGKLAGTTYRFRLSGRLEPRGRVFTELVAEAAVPTAPH